MKENKKVTLEQGSPDEYRRIIMEQGTDVSINSNTPQWDKMIVDTKEGVAHYTTLFVKSFISGIIPAFVFIVSIITIMIVAC